MDTHKTRVREILDLIKNKRLCPLEGNRLIRELRETGAGYVQGNSEPFSGPPALRLDGPQTPAAISAADSVPKHAENGQPIPDSPFQAIVLTRPGNIDDIQIQEFIPREPRETEVQILVKAFSINFGALLCVKGLYPTMPDYPFTPGFEVSGVVLKVGCDVHRVSIGDEVIGLAGFQMGGHSALINVDEGGVVRKPANVTHVEACAFPIVFLTMHRAFELAKINRGEKVLIQTAAGGTGLISVQLAQSLGAEVFATAGSQEKLDFLATLGVRHLINYREEDFAKRILEMTGNYGVDVVFNTLSGEAIQKGLDILAPEGRYIELAMTGLKAARSIDLSSLDNNQVFYSVDLRKQLLERSGIARQYLELMVQTLAEGKVKPIVGQVFPFSRVREAYRCLADRGNIGKIVVTMPEIDSSEPALSALNAVKNTEQVKIALPVTPGTDEVAIIGISGRFPGARNVGEFWQNLAAGKNSITEVPKERWDIDAYYDPDLRVLDKTHCRWGGFLSDIDQFDPLFFNISGREAQLTDPQQRLFLQESWTALEDAGYATERIANAKCGVFVGVGQSDYLDKMIAEGVEREPQSFWGNDASVLTARLSYFLNLKGAAIAINTACSSSLVAIHLAAQSILSGESQLAIAGGVFIRTAPTFHILNSNAAMLSPDGKCMTFDNKANGFVPGEGVGVVIMKRLAAALHDGDHIYGVIKSSGTNQDGKTNGITAPSTLSQTELELVVYQKAGINPETIGLVEAHGTGTKLGDPIEIEALTNAFRKHTQKQQYCAIGSVKTNIGHTVAAAGVAGVLKVLLALSHKQIPASLNFDQPNEHIDFAGSPFFVNTSLKDWEPAGDQPRRATVSSFGFSGTNAHLLIEEAPKDNRGAESSRPAYLFPVSAKTSAALEQKVSDLLTWLQSAGRANLADVAFTLHEGRSHFPVRAALVAGSIEELRQGLNALLSRGAEPNYLTNDLKEKPCPQDPAQKRLGNQLLVELGEGQLAEPALRQKLLALAGLYVQGYGLDWQRLYTDRQHRRLSLPTYPFSKGRYWIPASAPRKTNEAKVVHPLIDRIDSELSLKERGIAFRKVLRSSDPIAAHHQVQNQSIVPGVGHLEMAFAAFAQVKDTTDYKLTNVVWLQPLIVRADTKEVQIILKEENEILRYQIQSEAAGQTVVHSRGEFRRKEKLSEAANARLDIEAIKSRCKTQGGDKPFTKLQAIGISYGTFFQALSQLWEGSGEALGLLELPAEHLADFHRYFFHPTIMDGALQATIGLTGTPRNGQPVLPFGVEEVELFRPLTTRGYAYVTPGRQALEFDVTIVDDTGLVSAKIRGAAFRELKDPLQKLYYIPTWQRQPLAAAQTSPNHVEDPPQGSVLIVHSPQGLALAQALAASHSGVEVVNICLGSETRGLTDGRREIRANDPKALAACLETVNDIRTIYFLGGIQTPDPDPADQKALAQSQELGVISLFRLVKTLLDQGYGGKSLRLKVVTSDASEITPGGTRNPAAGSLIGFCKSLTLEHSNWEVSCLDISFETDQTDRNLIDSVRSEPRLSPAEEVAILDGVRYVRTIRPLNLPSTSTVPFRQQGVYLILGGAGGIGLELSNYLAEAVQARLVLLGRSALTTEQLEKIAAIEAKGAQVLYLQVDATNPEELKEAIEKARAQFGKINGVVHSALVLKDKTLENMDEPTLRAVLAPKVAGTVSLFDAVRNEELDFMLFFSSAQSICGNPGQSNYAAACTFKDAYAHYLRKKVNYPVQIINWGYWGEVGVVATAEHQRRLAAQGVYSISAAEGMETVKRTLGHSLNQVIPIKASEQLLTSMGIDLAQRVEMLPDTGLPSLVNLEHSEQPTINADQVERSVAAFHQLDLFGQRLLLAAFRRKGLFLAGGERYDKEQLRRELKIIPAYARLYEAVLRILNQAGFIGLDGSRLVTSPSLDDAVLQDQLANLEARRQQLSESFPEITVHLRLLWACAQHYLETLRGDFPATEALFPGHTMELVEGIYKGNTLVDHFNQLVAWSVQAYIAERIKTLPATEKITILEIGAGTGGTSAALFDSLRSHAGTLRYLYTDISASFTQYGKRQFAASNPQVEFKVLDIEQDVESQDYQPGMCDVVIATNVLHATRQLEPTLRNAKALLKSHGWLIINEVTRPQDFTTLTFGLLEGWWLFEDEKNRLENSPLLSAERWEQQLKEQGFAPIVRLSAPTSNGGVLGQNVMLAESDGKIVRANTLVQQTASRSRGPELESRRGSAAETAPDDGANNDSILAVRATAPAPSSGNQKETLRLHVETKVVESLAAILQLGQEVFDKNTPFTDFGVDSLLAVDIINKLNEVPGIKLRSTDLFNYSTVRQLTDYVVDECAAELGEVLQIDDSARAAPMALTAESFGEQRTQQAENFEPARNVSSQLEREVAVIGIAGQFPEADNTEEFWANLSHGRNSVREVSRWRSEQFYDSDPHAPNKSYSKWAGMLDNIQQFDPAFFNITPREAELMDPQQRLFLQQTWKAVEDAGYADKELDGKNCGVFVGCGPGDYNVKLKENNVPLEAYSFTGNSSSILTARISYLLNLKGPSVPVDTACSSSLVAIHLACESIRSGLSEMAIAGGVAVMNTPDFHILGSRGGMLSPVGQCKTFDDSADGFVPGEAVGVVILKSLAAAERDGDHIYGVISGSGINQDGKTNGITSPSGPAQTALECAVYERFGINPAELSYVEAHGTGTRLGDPIEVQALSDAFRRYTDKRQYCALGSVKTNIGHTLTAAGVASVIKVLLSFEHQQLAPSLNCAKPNRHIEFGDSPFFVNTKLQEWRREMGRLRQAAVSSFGFSGTNAHLVLREAGAAAEREADSKAGYLVVLSAQTGEALSRKVTELAEWLVAKQPGLLRDVAYTLQVGRSQFKERLAIVAVTVAELQTKLRAVASGEEPAGVYRGGEELVRLAGGAPKQESLAELLAAIRVERQTAAQYLKQLEGLAQLYVQGVEAPWRDLYQTEDHRRVSLPTYPFAKEYYDAPNYQSSLPSHVAQTHKLHPLIDRNVSTLREQRFTTRLTGEDLLLKHHVISGQKILPGAAYLEMALAAGAIAGEEKVAKLKNVYFARPISVEGSEALDVSISLRPSQELLEFEVSTGADRDQIVHAQGTIVYDSKLLTQPADVLDLEAILRRCPQSMTGPECYRVFETGGVKYGGCFRALERLNYGESEGLALLRLPDEQPQGSSEFVLTPSLVDAAFQTVVAFGSNTSPRTAYLPVALAELELLNELPATCYVHVRQTNNTTPGLKQFDLEITDETGMVCTRLKGFAVKAFRIPAPATDSVSSGLSRLSETDKLDPTNDELLKILREIERGTLKAEDAERLLGETYA